jgi:S1-C subfamily serine protease
MKKWLISAFAVVFLLGCNTTQYSESFYINGEVPNHGEIIYKKIKDSVVLVGDENSPYGSGYFIEGGYVATCYHVIEGIDTVYIQLRKDEGTYKFYEMEVLGVKADIDIAVLKFKDEIDDKLVKALKFRTNPLNIGQDVYLYGHPFMHTYYFSKGVISKFDERFPIEDMAYKAIYTDAFMAPGSSGGVMVDSNGDIIGMTSAAYIQYGIPVGVNIAVHLDELVKYTSAIIENPEEYPLPVIEEEEDPYYDDYYDEDYEDEGTEDSSVKSFGEFEIFMK